MTIRGVHQPVAVWPEITNLRIYFPLLGAKKATSQKWPAVGWTIRVPAEWKSDLREMLAEKDYTRDHMYPDFDGCRRLGAHVARSAVTD